MRLNQSKNRSVYFMMGIGVLILLLFSFKSLSPKSSKYAKTPSEHIQQTPLNLIQITLKEKHYNKLKKKRDKALRNGILETGDNDYVPAIVAFNGKDYEAQIRLKGDWTDHLIGDKWSFRIKLENDMTIMGMRKFSIHHPNTRGFINEWLYHKAIKNEELFGLRYGFVEGALHIKAENSSRYMNKDVGIYAIEETFDKRTIESNKRKESIILKFNENYWWADIKKSLAVAQPSGLHWNKFTTRAEFPIMMFTESKMLRDTTMNGYFRTGKNLLFNLKNGTYSLDQVFDVKKLAKYQAILNLFGAQHSSYIINMRFYYNPITSMLEPIAFDGNSGKKLQSFIPFYFYNEDKDDVYLRSLAYALEEVSKSEYLDKLLEENREEIEDYVKILKSEFRVKSFSEENLRYNQKILKQELARIQKKLGLTDIEIEADKTDAEGGEIEIGNPADWKSRNISVTNTGRNFQGNPSAVLSRVDDSKPANVEVQNIEVVNGGRYKVSVLVKRSRSNDHFGLRLQGKYPNRADAVFDLKSGKVKGANAIGTFQSESASIEAVGNNWYRCSIDIDVLTSNVKLILGPTKPEKQVQNWEGPVNSACSSELIPNSVRIERLSSEDL